MSDKPEDDLEKRVVEAMEGVGIGTLTEREMDLINEHVPDADLRTLRLARKPKPGEGSKVAVVTDSRGEVHRVLLKPH